MAEQNSGGGICPGCGEPVVCGAARGESICWCAELPAALPLPTTAGGACYCRRCLEKQLSVLPKPSRA